MRRSKGFDEVMIVNPYDPERATREGVRTMRLGYPMAGPYGAYAEDPYGTYAEPADLGGFAEDPYGAYAEDPYGEDFLGGAPYGAYSEDVYGELEPVGYIAEDPYGAYAEDPYGAYAEDPYGAYAEDPYGYAEPEFGVAMPEMVGYGEPPFEGYERDVPPAFNPGCPMPTNIAGFGEAPLEGYQRPGDVSPTCKEFAPPPISAQALPDTFRPLW